MSSLTLRPTAPYLPTEKTSCLLLPESRERLAIKNPNKKKRNEIKIKKNTHDNKTPLKLCSPPSLSGNLLHECFTAPRSSPCHVCIFNFLCCMRIKRDVQKGKERKKKNNDAISASAQPGAELCVSHSHNTRGKTWLQPPPDVCQDPHGTKKNPERMKLFVPSGYLHSAALRPPAGVAK